MAWIEHTNSEDLITWDHGPGVCKLIRIPREEIDEDSEEPDAWDLLWINARTNVREFESPLDNAFGREIEDRDRIAEYARTAPAEAREIIERYIGCIRDMRPTDGP